MLNRRFENSSPPRRQHIRYRGKQRLGIHRLVQNGVGTFVELPGTVRGAATPSFWRKAICGLSDDGPEIDWAARFVWFNRLTEHTTSCQLAVGLEAALRALEGNGEEKDNPEDPS